jgi:hydroxyacylglutathione hydrolase
VGTEYINLETVMFLRQISDAALAQNAYLIGCQRSGEAAVVDPERDVDRYLEEARRNGLRVTAVVETHIHADYLSGARELMERHGAVAYLPGEGGADWQFEWAKGHPDARFLRGGDRFRIGNIAFEAVSTPGHTPEHMSYLVTDMGGGADEPMVFLTGDFLFVGDVGRPDLLESAAGQAGVMEPSARTLYASLRSMASIADHVQVLPAHGAGSACGKALGAVPISVMGYERRFNAPFREALDGPEDRFVESILSGQPEPPLYFSRMKRDNRLGPALLAEGRLPMPRRIGVAELVERMGSSAILDLRADRAAFAERHVRGSLFAPLAGGVLSVVAGCYVKEGRPIVLVVESDSAVDEAVRQLVRIGLDRVEAWIPVQEALHDAAVTQAYPRISSQDLPAGAVVLDVRGAGEFAAGHVAGAVHIAHTRLAEQLREVPEGKPLYIHCAGGGRAAVAAAYLASLGREVVHVDGLFGEIPALLKS